MGNAAAQQSVVTGPAAQKLAVRNEYWVLRHGRSLANEQGIVVRISLKIYNDIS